MKERDDSIVIDADPSRSSSGSLSFRLGVKGACFLSIVLLISSGVFYRCVAIWLDRIEQIPVVLENPLSEFPMQVGKWNGKEVEISEAVLKVAGNDDYLSRLYINETTNQWASIYVAYTATPRTMLGHRPQKCYIAAGWVIDDSSKSQFTTSSGRKIDCLIHRFHMPAPSTGEVVVINFYVLNGKVTNEEDKFAGINLRSPNIDGNAARYVAQIQISSVVENSVRAAAIDLSDLVISFFPNESVSKSDKE